MIGDSYRYTGIDVEWSTVRTDVYGWRLSINFYDDGFCQPESTEGTLRTRYAVEMPLLNAVMMLLADAKKLGIGQIRNLIPALYCRTPGKQNEVMSVAVELGMRFADCSDTGEGR